MQVVLRDEHARLHRAQVGDLGKLRAFHDVGAEAVTQARREDDTCDWARYIERCCLRVYRAGLLGQAVALLCGRSVVGIVE